MVYKDTLIYKGHKNILILIDRIKRHFYKQPCTFKSLKNVYANEKIFLVMTGPSLTLSDLNLIKGQYSLSVNSIIKSYKQTSWRPNFYLITDPIPYKMFGGMINKEDYDYFFLPNNRQFSRDRRATYFNVSNEQWLESLKTERYDHILYPSHLEDKYFNNAYSCVFLAIQIAVYLGFREIYLLGQDCNYDTTAQHSSIVDPGYKAVEKKQMGEILIAIFQSYKDFYDKTDVKIYNCTRGGKLEVFERRKLENVVKKGKENE